MAEKSSSRSQATFPSSSSQPTKLDGSSENADSTDKGESVRAELERIRKVVTNGWVWASARGYQLPPAEDLATPRDLDRLAVKDDDLAQLNAIQLALGEQYFGVTDPGSYDELATGLSRLIVRGFWSGEWHMGEKYLLPNGSDEQEEERARNVRVLSILNNPEHADHNRLTAFVGVVLEQAAEREEEEEPPSTDEPPEEPKEPRSVGQILDAAHARGGPLTAKELALEMILFAVDLPTEKQEALGRILESYQGMPQKGGEKKEPELAPEKPAAPAKAFNVKGVQLEPEEGTTLISRAEKIDLSLTILGEALHPAGEITERMGDDLKMYLMSL